MMDQWLKAAVGNIARYGDTDVFPHPLEKHLFHDKSMAVREVLLQLHGDFDTYMRTHPPEYETALAVAGYHGFRAVTQIDPLWNAYLLALVLWIAEDIEGARVPREGNIVFSYRFDYDSQNAKLWDDESFGWRRFQEVSLELAQEHNYILKCDISDFYPRVYHHRLENALRRATTNTEATNRILAILQRLSTGNVSYGLPVGGPAARLLSELVLTPVDRLLSADGVTFCRFVDDYHVFADTREEAYRHLVRLSEKLLRNEGLLLQKLKTQVMTSEEFMATSPFTPNEDAGSAETEEARQFLSIRLRYDPYSDSPAEDYEALRAQLSQFDVVGMLTREMRKTHVHEALARRLISSLKHLDRDVRDDAVRSLASPDNLGVLYPVLPAVMRAFRDIIDDTSAATRDQVFRSLIALAREGSHLLGTPINMAYAVRVLAHDSSLEGEQALAHIYENSSSKVVRRDVILAMAAREAHHWLSDRLRQYTAATVWERTALLVSSYVLGDEGRHWREHLADGHLHPLDPVMKTWVSEKVNQERHWRLPL